MKLLLLSFNQTDEEVHKKVPTDISALGTRYLSSYLKAHGIVVKTLFLCKAFGESEPSEELEQIRDFIHKESPDFIGCSLMSNHFFRSRKVTQYIKQHFQIPVIWGGAHPTLEPEASLEWADMVCIGEGEEAMLELLSLYEHHRDYTSIPGIWSRNGKRLIQNPPRSLQENLDIFPFPDYQFGDQYVIHQGNLKPFDDALYRQYFPASSGQHRVIATRGCPHACSYCCNSAFRKMCEGRYLRRRSVENFIQEMEEVKRQFPYVKLFKIMDDSFIMGKQAWMEEFAEKYTDRIGVPFYCLLSPTSVTKEKLDVLVDAGLRLTQIGLQSGSDRVNREIYKRRMTQEQFLEAANTVAQFQPKLQVVFDVICDNPYETDEDRAETVRTLAQIPKPFNLGLFSLAFYPHTALYDRAVADGIIPERGDEYIRKQFHQIHNTYLNKLIRLTPKLSGKQILWFLEHRDSLTSRFLLHLVHWGFMKRDKIPHFVKKAIKRWLS